HVRREVVDDEVAALGRVLAHEELEAALDLAHRADVDRHEPDVLADELAELLRTDLAEPLEAGHLGALDRRDRRVALVLRIAVAGLGLVADAEERRLEDVDVA